MKLFLETQFFNFHDIQSKSNQTFSR